MVPLILLAWSAGATPVHEARWGPARTLGTLEQDGREWLVYEARSDRQVRLRCDGPAPRRAAVHLRDDGETLVMGPWPAPVRSEGGWQLAGVEHPAGVWAIDRTDCGVSLWREETAPEALDRLEWVSADPAALRRALLASDALREEPEARAQIETVAATDWWTTWVTLRPLGGFVDGMAPPHPDAGRRVAGGHGPADPTRAWEVPAGASWQVRGPAQIRLSARALGTADRVCLAADADAVARACQHSQPLEAPRFQREGRPSPPEHDGRPVGRRLVWQVWVPAGEHTLSLDTEALAWARSADLGVLGRLAPLPDTVAIASLTAPLPEDADRVTATVPDPVSEVVFGPTTSDWPAPEAVRWVRPDAVDGRPWWEPTGRASILVEAKDGPCTVALPDGRRWTAASPRALLHVARVGGAPADAPPPSAEGDCAIRLRVTAREHEPDAVVGVPVARLDALTPAHLTLPEPIEGPVQLRVFLPVDVAPSASLRVSTGRDVLLWRMTADATQGAWRTPDGTPWVGPVTLSLPDDTRSIEVAPDTPMLVQLSGRGPAAPVSDEPPPREAPPSRAASLRREAAAALRRGEPREARRALLLAAELDPSLDTREAARAVAAEGLTAWAPAGAWQPLDTTWVPADAPPALRDDAARGDDLAVARALGDEGVAWWLAAAREQVLTSHDAIAALQAVLAVGADPEDPAFGAVRGWTRGVPVTAIRRTLGWSTRRPPEPLEDPTWPADETLALGGGWTVRLPPLEAPTTLEARCRPEEVEALADPCRLLRVDAAGRVVDAWTLERWGDATRVPLDASERITFLELQASGRVSAALHVSPSLQERLPAEARVVRLTGERATLTVVAPTILEVTWWEPGASREGTLVTPEATVTVPVDGTPRTAWLSVRGEGPTPVELRLGRGALARVLRREPRDARRDPPDHATLLAALRNPVSSGTGVVLEAPTARPSTTARPSPPALTLRAEARAGLGAGFAQDPEATASVPVRGLQRLGLLSRPGALPLWIDVRLGAHEQLGRASAAEARLGLETWWRSTPVTGWVRADATVRSTFQPDLPTALRIDADAGIGWRPRRVFELRAVLGVRGRQRWGPWPARFGNAPDVLWSTFVEDHPLQGAGRLEARVFPTPWLRAVAFGALRTNAPGDRRPVDAVGGGMTLRAAWPGVRIDGAVSVDHRPADRHRVTPYLSPQLDLGVRGTLWARRDLAVQLVGRGAWLPYFRRLQGDVAVEILWSTRPGLPDLRPTLTDARFAHTWNQPERWVDWSANDAPRP